MSKALLSDTDDFIDFHLAEPLIKVRRNVCTFIIYNSFNSWGRMDNCNNEIVEQFKVIKKEAPHGYSQLNLFRKVRI